jgi:hypothetical protein
VLGFHFTPKRLDVRDKLPLQYGQAYEFYSASLANTPCILLKFVGQYLSIPRIRKHFEEIPKLLSMAVPCVLWLMRATDAQQTRLLEQRVPYIVKGEAVFLPFLSYLGIQGDTRPLQAEHMGSRTFTAAVQCVFLSLLTQASAECVIQDLIRKLRLSQATVSRALMELHQKGLLTVTGVHTRKKYRPIDRQSFWNEGRRYLLNPVIRTFYTDNGNNLRDIPTYHAGETALAAYGMLNAPGHACAAVDKSQLESIQKFAVTSPNDLYTEQYTIVEIWRYDPGLFADVDGRVDLFSLYASLGEQMDDERIAKEMEDAMERYFHGCGA